MTLGRARTAHAGRDIDDDADRRQRCGARGTVLCSAKSGPREEVPQDDRDVPRWMGGKLSGRASAS